MFNKLLGMVFLSLIFLSTGFAQNETTWEYLEVFRDARSTYHYWNEDIKIKTEISLEDLGKSGWELIGVNSSEYSNSLIFKRKYIQSRTLKEIEQLKAKALTNAKAKEAEKSFNLVDLDIKEFDQNLTKYNKSEEDRLRKILESIDEFPINIIKVESIAKIIGDPSVGAELTVDATALLKNNNQYRSSEVDIYLQKIVDRIKEIEEFTNNRGLILINSKSISTGAKSPYKIGEYKSYSGIGIQVSLLANFDGQQNIIAQAIIYNMKWNDKRENQGK